MDVNEIDIYCMNGKCPICSGDMKELFSPIWQKCINGCYNVSYLDANFVNIAKEKFIACTYINLSKEELFIPDKQGINGCLYKEELLNRISYWRENDRYLAEILTKGDK
ncbi:hypothetical protein D3C87_77110 [compost metagenome]